MNASGLSSEQLKLQARVRELAAGPVAGRAAEGVATVRHAAPMLSLDNAYDEDDARAFDERLRRALGRPRARLRPGRDDGGQREDGRQRAAEARWGHCAPALPDGITVSTSRFSGRK